MQDIVAGAKGGGVVVVVVPTRSFQGANRRIACTPCKIQMPMWSVVVKKEPPSARCPQLSQGSCPGIAAAGECCETQRQMQCECHGREGTARFNAGGCRRQGYAVNTTLRFQNIERLDVGLVGR